MKRILVTGGAGFIGSAVVRHIIEGTRDSVVVVDKLTYAGNLESLAGVADNERYAFEQVDICDRAALDRVFAQYQPDFVMHLAAESHVDRSIDGPAAFIETNPVPAKMALALMGRFPFEVRLPMVPLEPGNQAKLEAVLKTAGLL